MLVQHSDGEIVRIEFVKGIELSMSLVDANELHKELTWVLDAINPEPAPQTSEEVERNDSADVKPVEPSASHNTGMDAIPLWAVRTWLRRNVDSNLAIVETKIVEMVGIAEQHHT